jgi:hypothetical protein
MYTVEHAQRLKSLKAQYAVHRVPRTTTNLDPFGTKDVPKILILKKKCMLAYTRLAQCTAGDMKVG